ncbi:hypothetical protein [Streptomyces sp. NPDC005408]|uniref:hypothetical protein n=1 Tax=Streptomyces sp. NPDC005408 TaxID=3155341 RepID=UPI0033B002A4
MSVARRPLLTATAAGTLLCALWFVPSANATAETEAVTEAVQTQQTGAEAAAQGLALADTGTVDTTPYLIGGTAFLAIGVGFVTYSVRRPQSPAGLR